MHIHVCTHNSFGPPLTFATECYPILISKCTALMLEIQMCSSALNFLQKGYIRDTGQEKCLIQTKAESFCLHLYITN